MSKKLLFYAPMKPISDPVPSGDREIARGLHNFFVDNDYEVEVLSEFRTRFFYKDLKQSMKWPTEMVKAFAKSLKFKPDALFTYHTYYKAPDAISPFIAKTLGIPYFIFEGMHAERPSESWDTIAGYHLSRFPLTSSKHVFSDKEDDLEMLNKLMGPSRVTHVAPSIDTNLFRKNGTAAEEFRSKFNLDENKTTIVSIAMMRPDRKTEGLLFLIDALARVKQSHPELDFQLVIIGDGDKFEHVQKTALETLPGQATLTGGLEKDEIVGGLSASDIFAFPGIDEGFGLVYVEAQSCGLPVVALDNGGIPGAVNRNQSAFLTPFGDANAYADALRKLLESPQLREKMGTAARDYVLKNHSRTTNYKVLLEHV